MLDENKGIRKSIRIDLHAAYFNSGNAKANSKDFKGAIQDYDQAVKLHPNYAMVYNNRGLNAKADSNDNSEAQYRITTNL